METTANTIDVIVEANEKLSNAYLDTPYGKIKITNNNIKPAISIA